MKGLLKKLTKLGEDELLNLSNAVDIELERRLDQAEEISDSARRRAVQRSNSYRRSTGSTAPPVAATGLGKASRGRTAA